MKKAHELEILYEVVNFAEEMVDEETPEQLNQRQ